MKIKPLIRGNCPICNKVIMNKTKSEYINGGLEILVLLSDNSMAMFSICNDCYNKVTQEQLDEIMKSQIVNWGIEITKQMEWFYQKACHLKIIKHAKTKDEITS